jgi:ElaB/YqjD/DUF883 family membrane-anchored ribosome-binding protein
MNEVTREKLSSDFKALIGDVQELLKTTYSQTGERIAGLRQRLTKQSEEGTTALSEPERTLSKKAEEARTCATACLREKPWAALGVAAAIGLVLGLLSGRRK